MGEIISSAVAQSGGGTSILAMLPIFGGMLAIFWFMTIRPERKRATEREAMLAALKKGDEVVLTSGMFGKVHAVEDKAVVVEIADKTRVRILKVGVHGPASRVLGAPAAAGDDKKLEAAAAAPTDKAEKKPA